MTDERIAISLIVDSDPIFAYTAWHLAHSLVQRVGIPWSQIHVQCTAEVPSRTRDIFCALGCSVHVLARFGDGRYCNKLAQWDNLREVEADRILFLDTDMICVEDFMKFVPRDVISGKVVDLENPPLPVLQTLFERAGFAAYPEVIDTDAPGRTFKANCNGGFYSVPKRFADQLFEAWRRRALALLADIEPLRPVGKENHVDQIAFCMAIHETGLPFEDLPSNANYPLHLPGPMRLRRPGSLALLHYHNFSLNVLGLIELEREVDPWEEVAVAAANDQIKAHFHNETFWDFRYRHFPDRGSGVGSRGTNLEYKREILKAEGVESASSVLDVGCGDLEVVHALDLRNYVGVDPSPSSRAIAAGKRPDWTFRDALSPDIAPADMVLCFEVAIHQKSKKAYRDLIEFLASKTERTLIVSGYDALTEDIERNHMLAFHEPLQESLEATGRFSSIRKIGGHSDVAIYRCDVAA